MLTQSFTIDSWLTRCVAPLAFLVVTAVGCTQATSLADGSQTHAQEQKKMPNPNPDTPSSTKTEMATFGAGCFWCVEAVFQQLEGVEKVESGYTGGQVENPTYRQVCDGDTGHAEVCQITYDPKKISFEALLEVFWKTHDPTTLNRQGNDVGTQYRSAVFYHNDQQRELAEKYKQKLNEAKAFDSPVVTEITKLDKFYKAEDYHQNYYRENSDEGYCRIMIAPKVDKVRKVFASKVKKEE